MIEGGMGAVRERLEKGDPLGAWDRARAGSNEMAFVQAALERPRALSASERAPGERRPAWGGSAEDWREAGALCAQILLRRPSVEEAMIAGFLKAPRPEFLQGAASVAPERAWLNVAKPRVERSGLDGAALSDLKNGLLWLGADFQEALMALDWEGRRKLPRLGEPGPSARLPSASAGICHVAGWESEEPLRRALAFLSARGLSERDQLTREDGGDLPIVFAVAHLSEPCARLILKSAPELSAQRESARLLAFWKPAWEAIFGEPEAGVMIGRRQAFAERVDVEQALSQGSRRPGPGPRRV